MSKKAFDYFAMWMSLVCIFYLLGSFISNIESPLFALLSLGAMPVHFHNLFTAAKELA